MKQYVCGRLGALLISGLAILVSRSALAGDVAYVDMQRAMNECDEGKAASAELDALKNAKRKEADEANDAVKKAQAAKEKPDAVKAKQAKADDLTSSGRTAVNDKTTELTTKLVNRLNRILPAIAQARKLSVIVPVQSMVVLPFGPQQSMTGTIQAVAYVAPRADVTAELVRRANAGEGKEDKVAEISALKAKLAALERKPAATKQ
jgi:outer membrane protein